MTVATVVKGLVARVDRQDLSIAQVLAPLAEARINMCAISTISVGDARELQFVADDCEQATQLLQKKGITALVEQDLVKVEIDNAPGAVATVWTKLANAGIDVLSSWAAPVTEGRALYYLSTSANDKAVAILS